MTYPQNGQNLLDLFGDIGAAGYRDHVFLSDTKVGFSVQRAYPKNIRYKPAKTLTGVDDNIAAIWVVYEDGQETKGTGLVPLRLRIATMSKYRTKHLFDDDGDEADRPTSESIAASKNCPQPLELSLRGYFFDAHINGFVDSKGTQVTGLSILNELFDAHCDTVHPVKGLRTRGIQFAHSISRSVFDKLIDLSRWTLKVVFGLTLIEHPHKSSYFHGYEKADLGSLAEDSFNIFNVKVSKRLLPAFIVFYAVTAYFAFPIQERTYADYVLRSEVLMTIHVVAVLYFIQSIVPSILFRLLNLLILLRRTYLDWLLRRSH